MREDPARGFAHEGSSRPAEGIDRAITRLTAPEFVGADLAGEDRAYDEFRTIMGPEQPPRFREIAVNGARGQPERAGDLPHPARTTQSRGRGCRRGGFCRASLDPASRRAA